MVDRSMFTLNFKVGDRVRVISNLHKHSSLPTHNLAIGTSAIVVEISTLSGTCAIEDEKNSKERRKAQIIKEAIETLVKYGYTVLAPKE